jgi:uncharacterized protein
MSEAKGQQHEPSMEEILASIRRIIAEDGDTTAAPESAPAAAESKPADPRPAEPAADEILELTEVIEADGSVVSLGSPVAEPVVERPAPAPVIQLPQPPPRAPEPVAPPRPAEDEPFESDPIVSAATAAASVAALSQITALSGRTEPRSERDIPLGAGHLTLEMLVREELRPILKDWLDRNLPDMVERLVQVEIARLVSDVQRR